jgi:sec-independent protein translocase protein TatA
MGLDNPLHIAFLVVILLLVFGARRLPEIGRSLGSGMREFKDSVTGETKQATLPGPQAPQTVAQPAPVAEPVPVPPASTPTGVDAPGA